MYQLQEGVSVDSAHKHMRSKEAFTFENDLI